MIDPKELRIGNMVRIKDVPVKVYDFNETGINQDISSGYYGDYEVEYDGYFNPDYAWRGNIVSPILLTEEWLLKAGFDKQLLDLENPDEGYFYSSRLSNEIHCDLSLLSGDKNGFLEVCLFPYNDNFRFRYVHQLQNVYFILTGHELYIT